MTAILETLTNGALAGLYQQVTGANAARFSSRAAGLKRVRAALESRNLTVEIEDGAPILINRVEAPARAGVRQGRSNFDAHVTDRAVTLNTAAAMAEYKAEDVVAELPEGTAAVYRALLGQAEGCVSTDDTGRQFRTTYLDNARPGGMPPRVFAATLSVLAQRGLYRPLDNEAFGEVLLTSIETATPIGIKAGAGQLDAHVEAMRFVRADKGAVARLLDQVQAPAPAAAEDNGISEYIRRLRSMPNERRPGLRVMDPKPGKEKPAKAADGQPRAGSKNEQMLAMVLAEGGATEEEICKAIGWKACAVTLKRAAAKAGISLTLVKQPGEKRGRYVGQRAA
ncbi:DUF3489 domain-containing protein [Methylobacterium nodulans]|uniref:DUF3489 domain-containing protein n=1 Tax=Methylobacterium nodulans (strain LMG 21967 / CNCM I-2342 / ORS 2060) TaxID=460265 RepID=B8IIU1_METNO|nr:DUF3489 domain-containing protein [Methylobacterium nodulans]ACL61736.1 hypothetical protein Mnod_6994 [Methylobacterium nodulans ORS 2060]